MKSAWNWVGTEFHAEKSPARIAPAGLLSVMCHVTGYAARSRR
jgi:hypothetical protein